MTYQELVNQLEEIKKEYCPTTAEDYQRAIESGFNDLCGCAICQLTCSLMIAEIQGKSPITSIPGGFEQPAMELATL